MMLSVTFLKNDSKRLALLRLPKSDRFMISENEPGTTNVWLCVISLKMTRESFLATTNAADGCEHVQQG